MDDSAFRRLVLVYHRKYGRHDLPWRHRITPYRILVSEVMLQQTQVPRVVPKFRAFLRAFPTFRALARAPAADVLRLWQGLGYNRRALMLQRCAQAVVQQHAGRLPDTPEALRMLPGIGSYTAGALMAFAFNRPVPVIETNIRRVILHHYFSGRRAVLDADILPIVERTLDRKEPRRWYGALMDYGTHLAATVENPNRRSRHHVRQSRFEGSARQLRGRVLKALLTDGPMTKARLTAAVGPDERLDGILARLEREGFIHRPGGRGPYSVV